MIQCGLQDLEAMILAGGKGSRLQAVLNDRPKPMAPVAGRPFLEWLLLWIRGQGVNRAVLCTGHMGEVIQNHFRDGHSLAMKVSYSHEAVPLGTAGAIRLGLQEVKGARFLVLNGDSYCRADLGRLMEFHTLRSAKATIWLVKVEDCRRYGSVDVRADGSITAFREKSGEPSPGTINAGIYLLDRKIAESIPSGRVVSLETEIFPKLIGNGLYAVAGNGPFLDIGTPESYALAEDFLATERGA